MTGSLSYVLLSCTLSSQNVIYVKKKCTRLEAGVETARDSQKNAVIQHNPIVYMISSGHTMRLSSFSKSAGETACTGDSSKSRKLRVTIYSAFILFAHDA